MSKQPKEKAVLISIVRTDKGPEQTLGKLFAIDKNLKVLFECETLELPWRHNRRNISCIPPGRYKARKRTSKKFGDHLHILDVRGRDFILIHEANFSRQLRGCIAVGRHRADIDSDGLLDVTSSQETKLELLKFLGTETEIAIT